MAKIDFAKGFIWSSVVLAVVGVGFHFYLQKRLQAADGETKRALEMLQAISIDRKNIELLATEKDNDDYLKRDKSARLDEFLAEMANNAGMERGPSKDRPSDDTPNAAHGYKDTSSEISWLGDRNRKLRFSREQIAHFCWSIENRTALLKITSIQLTTDRETLDDQWDARFTITERAPTTLGG